ncbi:MAG TPA: 5'-nucleotidase C-terminal domain-containing protein [Geminicoccaceae bacterium]|nr:5'-nucleotidase C-terminal domain-containing protein [Geminicoccaceae bacterium]
MSTLQRSLVGPSAALALLLAGGALAEPVTITLLHTNDVYEIAPKEGRGGLAELMTLLEQERAAAAHSITTFGGDLISPSVLSGLTKGTQMIELYNLLGTDVAVLGNHEFDYGPEVLAERVAASKFPWLGSNVLGPDGKPALGTVTTQMIERAGYRIGFFGILTTETDVLSSPGEAVTFAPTVATATAAVAQLQADGADLIIALTHVDLADDRALARGVDGIDLILGGHDHEPITFYEGGVLIAKAGYDAHYLAAIDLAVDRVMERDKEVVQVIPAWRYLTTAGIAPDPEVKAVVDRYEAELDEQLNVPVGTTTVELDSRRSTVRTAESNFGNLIADAIRTAVGADVALANGGGIRGDRTYDAGTVLTRKDILTELPFGNVTVLIELTGADLLATLENGVSQVEDTAGRFPQVSGMSYRYDASRPAGGRIVAVEVGGRPLEMGRTYRLATNDFIFGGGDGYEALARGKAIIDASAGTLMATTVMDHIAQQGEIAPKVEGRITRLN